MALLGAVTRAMGPMALLGAVRGLGLAQAPRP